MAGRWYWVPWPPASLYEGKSMTPEDIITIGQRALEVTVLLAAPVLGTALMVGLLVGIFQAATSINEMTFSSVPRLASVAVVLMVSGSWMLEIIMDFFIDIIQSIPELVF